MSEPRAFTEEEVRAKFLKQVQTLVWYWATTDNPDAGGLKDRCEGVAFSILALLDGCDMMLPSFKVSPLPAPEDKEYLQSHGENWYPEDIDIAGSLHDQLSKFRIP